MPPGAAAPPAPPRYASGVVFFSRKSEELRKFSRPLDLILVIQILTGVPYIQYFHTFLHVLHF